MFLTSINLAKRKSKSVLIQMVSAAGTGYCFNTKKNRQREKLVLRNTTQSVEGVHFSTEGHYLYGCMILNQYVLFIEKKKIRSI